MLRMTFRVLAVTTLALLAFVDGLQIPEPDANEENRSENGRNPPGNPRSQALVSGTRYYALDCTITASSMWNAYYSPFCGRILGENPRPAECHYSRLYWSPAGDTVPSDAWWQVVFSARDQYMIDAITTQGYTRNGQDYYVSQYELYYIVNQDLIPYRQGNEVRTFSVDSPAATRQRLTPPIRARAVRLQVVSAGQANRFTDVRLSVELYGYRLN